MSHKKDMQGLTMLEMLITLAMIGILVGIALPSFVDTLGGSGVSGTTKSFFNALGVARSEAVSRNRTVNICAANAAFTDCESINVAVPAGWFNWSQGWIAFIDNNADATGAAGSIDAGDEILQVFSVSGNITATSQSAMLGYDPRGFGSNGGSRNVKFCPQNDDASLARGIEIFVTGSTRLVDTGLACP